METQHPHPDAPWPPRIAAAEGPIYLAIADAIGAAIQAGQLRPGDRLPTHRALADDLGVDLTTVTRAYAEARRRGLLHATVGRGTFVGRQDATPATPPPEPVAGPVDLGMNLPPQPLDPPLRDLLRQVFTSSVPARLGYLLARPALDRLREWMDPRRYNGAILIGLNGVVVKSHGGTDAIGFAHAVDVAMDMVTHGFNERIREGLSRLSTNGPRVAADSP